MNKYMKIAAEEAAKGVKRNKGGPFGAVIVRKGKVIAKSHNEVIGTNDPTAHAEIVAIRKASAKLKRFDLSDCEIYSSCEPCPMCLAAIYWANIKKLYYGCTKEDAARINFADNFIYQAIRGKAGKKKIAVQKIDRDECLKLFKGWELKVDKVQY